jgi:hypothetical protein
MVAVGAEAGEFEVSAYAQVVPLMVEGHPPMWQFRPGMPSPDQAEPYEYEGQLYWIEKREWSGPAGSSFVVSAVGRDNSKAAEDLVTRINALVACATKMVELLDDAEVNHGGLYSTITLRGRNNLRLELSKWK